MLDLRDVTVPGRERPRLRGLSLSLKPGERVALVGASGAGKSTLLGVANGLIQPTSGSVQWFGANRGCAVACVRVSARSGKTCA